MQYIISYIKYAILKNKNPFIRFEINTGDSAKPVYKTVPRCGYSVSDEFGKFRNALTAKKVLFTDICNLRNAATEVVAVVWMHYEHNPVFDLSEEDISFLESIGASFRIEIRP